MKGQAARLVCVSVCRVKVQMDTNHALEVMPDEEEDEVEVGPSHLVSRPHPILPLLWLTAFLCANLHSLRVQQRGRNHTVCIAFCNSLMLMHRETACTLTAHLTSKGSIQSRQMSGRI